MKEGAFYLSYIEFDVLIRLATLAKPLNPPLTCYYVQTLIQRLPSYSDAPSLGIRFVFFFR